MRLTTGTFSANNNNKIPSFIHVFFDNTKIGVIVVIGSSSSIIIVVIVVDCCPEIDSVGP